MKEGRGRRQLSLPPFFPPFSPVPAIYWQVTRSKIPFHTFQRPEARSAETGHTAGHIGGHRKIPYRFNLSQLLELTVIV
jgi:hypothetical protein